MPTFTQTGRLMALTTPLGADVLLLEHFSGTEALSQLFEYRLEALCLTTATWTFDQLLGQSATVALKLPDGSFRYFNGIVNAIAQGQRVRGALGTESFDGYRLSVVPIQVPPLRNRAEDIPLLVQYFLERFAARIGKRVERISPDTMRRIIAYPWPGNVRELENVLERAVIVATRPMLDVDLDVLGFPASDVVAQTSGSLEDVERSHILNVLRQTRWVIDGRQGAAAILGLHPNTLRSRLKKLGIARPPYDHS